MKNIRHVLVWLLVMPFLAGCEMAGFTPFAPPQQAAVAGAPAKYGAVAKASYKIIPPRRNALARHVISFRNGRGNLETYKFRILIPRGFRFIGFPAQKKPIGKVTFDWTFNGKANHTINIYALSKTTAYADVGGNKAFTRAKEPFIRYVKTKKRQAIVVTLPFGGDGNPATITGFGPMQITLFLNKGILRNPAKAGRYVFTGVFTSVDPDTDGPNNKAGAPPKKRRFSKRIRIL